MNVRSGGGFDEAAGAAGNGCRVPLELLRREESVPRCPASSREDAEPAHDRARWLHRPQSKSRKPGREEIRIGGKQRLDLVGNGKHCDIAAARADDAERQSGAVAAGRDRQHWVSDAIAAPQKHRYRVETGLLSSVFPAIRAGVFGDSRPGSMEQGPLN
jgi:hypothetical protein